MLHVRKGTCGQLAKLRLYPETLVEQWRLLSEHVKHRQNFAG